MNWQEIFSKWQRKAETTAEAPPPTLQEVQANFSHHYASSYTGSAGFGSPSLPFINSNPAQTVALKKPTDKQLLTNILESKMLNIQRNG